MTGTVAPRERAAEAAPPLKPRAITNEMELPMQVNSASNNIGFALGVFDRAIRPRIAIDPIVHPSKRAIATA
jgi:hypothetical protein